MVIKIVWYWHQKQIHNQWNTVGSSEINVCTYYGQLIYNKGSKNTQWRKDSLFNKLCWGNWTIIFKRIEKTEIGIFSNTISVMSNSLGPQGLQPTRLLCLWDFPGKNTGVGCHFLLQGIFLTQGLKPGLPHCRQTLYCLSHLGSTIPYTKINSKWLKT